MSNFYAQLAYNANGGGGAPAAQTKSTTTIGGVVTFTISSSKPSRTYYNFLGWSRSSGASTGSYAPGGSIGIEASGVIDGTKTTTIYAVWQHQTAYVYYNANGGSGAPSTQSHWAGYSVTLSATTPTRSGYNFKGWATSPTATVKQYDPNTSYALYTTVTLYAVWEQAASTLTASNGTMGATLTIGITRQNNSYTDTITYSFGSATGTIVTKTNNASVSWTPPTTLASQIPNASSGTCTFTCTTYNGNTVVGTSTKTITLSVPNSLAPTVSVSYADTNATCLAWGVLVQSRSTLAFSITASGQESATIASYQTTVNGTTYNSASFTTDVLLYNGTNTYSVTVTDSRGKQTTSTGTFSVVAYSVPSITLTLCDRDDSDDEQINVEFGFSVASVSNNNDANYRLDYKLKSSSTWTNGTVTSLGGYSGTITDTIAGRDGGDEWDIRINVIDSFQTTSIESEVGVSGNILLNSRHAGGLGLLMKSQADDQCDIGKKTVFHETVDVIPRRAYATLSSAGWYRVLTYQGQDAVDIKGGRGLVIHFDIQRGRLSESHSITMRMITDTIYFVDESSKSYSDSYRLIDKIRYTYNTNLLQGYIDIHYSSTWSAGVGVMFDVCGAYDGFAQCVTSNDLTAVLDAPTGETIDTTYTFIADTDGYLEYTACGKKWYFQKKNGVVFLNAPNDATSASAGTNVICNLPSSWRPYVTTRIPIANSTTLTFVTVETNGKVTLYTPTAISSATNNSFSGSWIAYS